MQSSTSSSDLAFTYNTGRTEASRCSDELWVFGVLDPDADWWHRSMLGVGPAGACGEDSSPPKSRGRHLHTYLNSNIQIRQQATRLSNFTDGQNLTKPADCILPNISDT